MASQEFRISPYNRKFDGYCKEKNKDNLPMWLESKIPEVALFIVSDYLPSHPWRRTFRTSSAYALTNASELMLTSKDFNVGWNYRKTESIVGCVSIVKAINPKNDLQERIFSSLLNQTNPTYWPGPEINRYPFYDDEYSTKKILQIESWNVTSNYYESTQPFSLTVGIHSYKDTNHDYSNPKQKIPIPPDKVISIVNKIRRANKLPALHTRSKMIEWIKSRVHLYKSLNDHLEKYIQLRKKVCQMYEHCDAYGAIQNIEEEMIEIADYLCFAMYEFYQVYEIEFCRGFVSNGSSLKDLMEYMESLNEDLYEWICFMHLKIFEINGLVEYLMDTRILFAHPFVWR